MNSAACCSEWHPTYKSEHCISRHLHDAGWLALREKSPKLPQVSIEIHSVYWQKLPTNTVGWCEERAFRLQKIPARIPRVPESRSGSSENRRTEKLNRLHQVECSKRTTGLWRRAKATQADWLTDVLQKGNCRNNADPSLTQSTVVVFTVVICEQTELGTLQYNDTKTSHTGK